MAVLVHVYAIGKHHLLAAATKGERFLHIAPKMAPFEYHWTNLIVDACYGPRD